MYVNNMRVEFKLNLLHSLDIVVNNLLYKEDHTYKVYQSKLTVISIRVFIWSLSIWHKDLRLIISNNNNFLGFVR